MAGETKEPTGVEGEFGYTEYDEKDFKDDALEDDDSSADDKSKGDTKDGQVTDATKTADAKKDETPADDAAGDSGSTDDVDDGEGSGNSEKTAKGDDKPDEYTPNFKYRVYDQEKEFDPKLQALITDKASEDTIRDLVTKAEGLDVLKPTHQRIVQDRDKIASERNALSANANRIMGLRDSNRRLFFAELGVTDQMLVAAAREIADAQDPENPSGWTQFQQMRQAEWNAHVANLQNSQTQANANQSAVQAHEQALQRAFSAPHVSTFAQRFDALHGQGAFREAVEARGNFLYHQRGYVDPQLVAEDVIAFQSKGMALTPAPATPTPGSTVTPAGGTPAVRPRPKGLPNVGRGRASTSPIGKRPKNVKELKEYAKRELRKMGEG